MSGRPILNAFVCGLLLVGSASATVRHDHDHGAAAHAHLLLFGFEVSEGDAPALSPGVSVGLAAVTDDGRDAVPTPPANTPPAAPLVALAPTRPTAPRPAPLPGRGNVCDSARGERSGVRLA